ncbi:hypothetical protein L7F22_012753 [Adiantum nelumboides]|nr:hypothetical protein [Adiantum nelumboides]
MMHSFLQSCVTLSTTEAEYVAASEACKEAIWLTRLVGDLGIVREIPVLHCDSQSAIQLARNLVFHAKTKHVDVRYHFIREVLEDKRLQLVKVHTDLLTKSLSSERFTHCRELMVCVRFHLLPRLQQVLQCEDGKIVEVKEAIKEEITKAIVETIEIKTKAMAVSIEGKMDAMKEGWVEVVRKNL